MDAFKWVRELIGKLLAEFGGRVVFVGLQGSRARGEAHEEHCEPLMLLEGSAQVESA